MPFGDFCETFRVKAARNVTIWNDLTILQDTGPEI